MYLKREQARQIIDALRWSYSGLDDKGLATPALKQTLAECIAMVERMMSIDIENKKESRQ